MKTLTIALMTALISFSSFASTVNCDIYSKNETGNWDQVDSLRLGSIGAGAYIQEAGNEIKGLKGKFINVAIGGIEKNMTASVDILDGGPRFQGKMILSAQGSLERGLSGAAYSEGISYLCSIER